VVYYEEGVGEGETKCFDQRVSTVQFRQIVEVDCDSMMESSKGVVNGSNHHTCY
jgi:hypothetical protein